MPNEDSWDAVTKSPYANPYDKSRPFAAPNAPDPMDLAAMKTYESMQQGGGGSPQGGPSGSYQYPGQPKINIPMDAQGHVQPGFHAASMESQGRNDPNARPPAPQPQAMQAPKPQQAAPMGAPPQGQPQQGMPQGAPQAPPEKPNAFMYPPNPPK